jgi:hypothetical protein
MTLDHALFRVSKIFKQENYVPSGVAILVYHLSLPGGRWGLTRRSGEPGKGANETKPEGLLFIRGSGVPKFQPGQAPTVNYTHVLY